MKKLLTLALAIPLLAAFAGHSAAQQKAGKPGSTVISPPPQVQVKVVTGQVTQVNVTARTITIKRTDASFIDLDYSKLPTPPRVGQNVTVQYTDVGSKSTAQAIAAGAPGSPAGRAADPCANCRKHCPNGRCIMDPGDTSCACSHSEPN
jgi:hypothetical protein